MKTKLKVTSAAIVLTALLAGCGGIPQADYDAARAEVAALTAERDGLLSDVSDLQLNYEVLSANKDIAVGNYDAVSAEFAKFQREMAVFADMSEEEARVRLEEARRGAEIERLDGEVAARQTELERLQTLIVRTGEEPIRLQAGTWYVGQDIPPGRYQASNGSSNFFTRPAAGGWGGSNVILGGRFGVDTYVFSVRAGDQIETRAAVTLTPIQ